MTQTPSEPSRPRTFCMTSTWPSSSMGRSREAVSQTEGSFTPSFSASPTP